MESFTYTGLPSRVLFGRGTVTRVAAELERLGVGRALVLSTPDQEPQAAALAEDLGGLSAGVHAGAVMHTPTEVTETALDIARAKGADGLVSLGGGSTIGLGKAIALRTGLAHLAVPTTYAGSEMTPILGQTEDGVKTTLRDHAVLPQTVVYDVDLTLTLPAALSATSGINAIAHAIEALYAQDRNPIVSLMANEAIEALVAALPAIVADPADIEARARALYGAWLCGAALGSVGMALHHKLCHTLGGSFDLPHAPTHTVVLPHSAAFNAQAVPELLARAGAALGGQGVGAGLFDLAQRIGAPTSLKEIGMPEDGLERAADLATRNPYWNPRPFTREDIHSLLTDAYLGRRPTH